MVFVGWVEGTELIEEAFVLPLQLLYVQLELCNLPLWIVGQLGLLYKQGHSCDQERMHYNGGS